jgi:cyclic pyranopterin phosphate synthase
MNDELTHLDEEGRVRMVDVGGKKETVRTATAEGSVRVAPATIVRIVDGDLPKGEVIPTARLAGIQAAKRTSELIPLCHAIRLSTVEIHIEQDGEDSLKITATARAKDRTGVEMEALTAVSVAALTIYDMVKAVDRGATIDGVRLMKKSGGRTGRWQRSTL